MRGSIKSYCFSMTLFDDVVAIICQLMVNSERGETVFILTSYLSCIFSFFARYFRKSVVAFFVVSSFPASSL